MHQTNERMSPREVGSNPARAVLLASAVALGCFASDLVLHAGAVAASGPASDPARRLHVVAFDLSRSASRALPRFCVRLASGEAPVRTDEITLAYARRILPRFQPPAGAGPTYFRAAPAHDTSTHDVFEGGGFLVSFRAGELVALSATSIHGERPEIGPPTCAQLFALPIDRAQFGEIFGPPEREEELDRL